MEPRSLWEMRDSTACRVELPQSSGRSPTENNIVIVEDCYYSQMRHCRLVSSMAAVLTMATRLSSGCNLGLEIVMNLRCRAGSTTMRLLESMFLQLLADEARIAMRLKTSLVVCKSARQVMS
jgi:hypothetical protein